MATLKFPNMAPPRGWQYFEARSRLTIKDDNLYSLTQKVIDHRKHKGWGPVDTKTVRLEIERQICQRLGTDLCIPESANDSWKPTSDISTSIGLEQVMAFSRAAFEWLKSGGDMVSLEENERRRAICAECPLNQPMNGCKCAPFYKILSNIIPDNRRHSDLHICGICGCSLQAKCASPVNVIKQSDKGRDLSYPTQCWITRL